MQRQANACEFATATWQLTGTSNRAERVDRAAVACGPEHVVPLSLEMMSATLVSIMHAVELKVERCRRV